MTGVPTRSELIDVFDRVVEELDPGLGVRRALSVDDGEIAIDGKWIGSFDAGDITVVGVGKASIAMASAVVDLTGARRAVVATPYETEAHRSIDLHLGGHPVPTQASLDAGRALKEAVDAAEPDDLVIAVVSGGGSACADLLLGGVSLADVVALNERLVSSGLPIEDVNEVRAAVSAFKAGGLVADCRASVVTLVLSDVVGGRPDVVASGPTIASSLGTRAQAILDGFDDGSIPAGVRRAVAGRGEPGSGDRSIVAVVGSIERVAQAAKTHIERRGYRADVVTDRLVGEASVKARDLFAQIEPGVVGIACGETTVTGASEGGGMGGRNQEAALAVLVDTARSGGVFAALGTDGIDGRTAAAGAIVDSTSLDAVRRRGWDWRTELATHNSGPLLSDIEAVVVTGATGTNVGDLWMWARAETGSG